VAGFLGIDCGSISLNLVLLQEEAGAPICVYRRIRGRSFHALIEGLDEIQARCNSDLRFTSAMVTGSARDLFSQSLGIPAVNEITAHATGVFRVNPRVRTVIEVGGQDSKFIKIEPPAEGPTPRVSVFRMNEVCAAGTGAFLDEQADRLGIRVESFGSLALQSDKPAPIAGRCAVFAKTDMIHQAQEGTPVPDILLGLAFALVRNYIATLIRGETLEPLVALQGGVMNNQAVVRAFQELLEIRTDLIIRPSHFEVLGAWGCAILAEREKPVPELSLEELKVRAERALQSPPQRSFFPRLTAACRTAVPMRQEDTTSRGRHESGSGKGQAASRCAENGQTVRPPLILGLDVGSVSVKGVIVDSTGRIVKQDYRLSRSRPLETADEVIRCLTEAALVPDVVAVTGSGRQLIGRLLRAELIVNEIIAQAHAALSHDPDTDTVVEIGGQDSKWISLENGNIQDFEMNRVCAAGTGSFLMAQASRLDLDMGKAFTDASFASLTPADLGNRCTVFMESDLIHHQNNGASVEDLAAGVCISIVQNYLERVANHKPLGKKVLFLGGVAASDAVRVAMEQHTGRDFRTPDFHNVSGALGAALKAGEALSKGEIVPCERNGIAYDSSKIKRSQFQCRGCTNECRVHRYEYDGRTLFHGGLCDRWETEKPADLKKDDTDAFTLRSRLLDACVESRVHAEDTWGMIRSPQFYDWFPFWKAFCEELGIGLRVSPPANRKQFEQGSRFLRVETCLPMKVLAGQVCDLAEQGVKTLFHPVILSEQPLAEDEGPLEHCPYVQASSQLFRDILDFAWKEPAISLALDPDSFRREHIRFAATLGFSREKALKALNVGIEQLSVFRGRLRDAGEQFLHGLGPREQALVVLGKPYHNADSFLNMNLAGLFHRLGIRALPSDLYPLQKEPVSSEVPWKYQSEMIRVARELADEPNLFPVMITFFGCGPDPFTLRHIKDVLNGKPLLVLEMDEHSSRAGVITRLEAFLDQVRRSTHRPRPAIRRAEVDERNAAVIDLPMLLARPSLLSKARFLSPGPIEDRSRRRAQFQTSSSEPKPEVMYLPYLGDHTWALAGAARSLDIDARVLPPPDEESQRLGRPHTVGGECHPYVLVLGDYLKLAHSLSSRDGERSRFYMLSADACRLGQYPVYIDKIRQQLGLSPGVIFDVSDGLKAFGLSPLNRQRALLRVWEGLNAYDVLARALYEVRPFATDREMLNRVHKEACNTVFQGLSCSRVHQSLDEALQSVYSVPMDDLDPKPQVAITGDYYTRVVPFANNDVHAEVEALGGMLRPPPAYSDCFKMSVLRGSVWSVLNRNARAAARNGLFYVMMAMSELKLKRSRTVRRAIDAPLDIAGFQLWKTVSDHAETRLPAGITAPVATALQEAERKADGILNLMTLNCSFGTVVTAALSRALRQGQNTPMLTLIYDGLKKTNEKTRLEAFMEQVWDHFRNRQNREGKRTARL
jgi:predicted CoA-substrate-specific enzyme activase